MPTACDPEERPNDPCGGEKAAPNPEDLPPFDRVKQTTPPGFHVLLEKIIRTVFLNRPRFILQFVADYLNRELEIKALGDLQCGCLLKKSRIGTVYPTASCTIMDKRYAAVGEVEAEVTEGITPDENEPPVPPEEDMTNLFTRGPIPNYELKSPALDRYRECINLEDFFEYLHAEQTDESNCPCGFCTKRRAAEQAQEEEQEHAAEHGGGELKPAHADGEPGSAHGSKLSATGSKQGSKQSATAGGLKQGSKQSATAPGSQKTSQHSTSKLPPLLPPENDPDDEVEVEKEEVLEADAEDENKK